MKKIHILWVDDEIDLLKPHILFLEGKNYIVSKCTNGSDAIDLITNNNYDIVFLDENMPGLTGIETLTEIKNFKPNLPVIMITKSEEEYIMEDAIGSKIADYLIKPVNPSQILLSLKKNLDHSRLISQKTTSNYQQEFRKISMDLAIVNSYQEWIELYHKLLHWELELENINDSGMLSILESQKQEANSLFFKFIKKNYQDLLTGQDRPVFSHTLFKEVILPEMKNENGTLMIVIDNLRYDQWKSIEPLINTFYKKTKETSYFSILPTATQYARNAIFSGLSPLDMEKKHPNYWRNDEEEGGKNLYEKEFLAAQINRLKPELSFDYQKITTLKAAKEVDANFNNLKKHDLAVIVYNFIDMLSHSKTDVNVIKELAGNEKAYRSLTLSWFKNSPIFNTIQKARKAGMQLVITTDHGTINCKNPSKVIGTKNISSNLRYKTGSSLTYEEKNVYAVKNPKNIYLPTQHMNSSFIFAKEDQFFVYPNNYSRFVKYFKNTYQHGGISLEEMIIPCAIFEPK
ncbi:PglZ domain-containing protein [Flavicella sp.]|uniref:T9SS response regulator signal transducer PorX n=1 Tax=Flavicella sp. TaxID=2957742 RepID=UPI0030166BE7